MSLNEYFGDWLKVIDTTELNNILRVIGNLYKTKSITPNQDVVFKAFNLCKFNDLKLIIIGQDVYPQKGVATGLAFANNTDNLSPSLQIIKESIINFELPNYSSTFDPTLESWAKQGILLLNSSLTCEVNKVGSHINLWRPFISKLLSNLSIYDSGLVYALFGSVASSLKPYIKGNVLEFKHPAYYYRTNTKMPYDVFPQIKKAVYQYRGEVINFK